MESTGPKGITTSRSSTMLVAPRSGCRLTTDFRTVAVTCGPAPVRTVERSSSNVTSRTQWTLVLDSPVLAQPGSDRGGASLFERQAADCVDHLDGAGASGDHDAFAGDLNDLSGVGESDAAGGGEDLEGASFAAAVAAVVVGADNRDLGPSSLIGRALRPSACLPAQQSSRLIESALMRVALRRLLAVLLVAAGLFGGTGITAPTAGALGWGAIAISPDTGTVGYSKGLNSAIEAEQAAVGLCKARDCRAVVNFTNACGAVAQHSTRPGHGAGTAAAPARRTGH